MRVKEAEKETLFPVRTPLKNLEFEFEGNDKLGFLNAVDDDNADDDIAVAPDMALNRILALSIQLFFAVACGDAFS